MDRETPTGRGGGEPFPSFDPEFTPQGGRRERGSGPPRQPPSAAPNPWLVGLAVAVVLATVSVIAFGIFTGPEGTTTGASSTTTTLPGDGTGTETTTPGDGTGTTTPGDGTGSTITLPGGGTPAGPIDPVGDPIPIGELLMSSDDIGPLDFGANADDVLGRLVATFGQPTDDTGFIVGSGSFGECPGDSLRVVRWGPLNIIVIGETGSATFEGYRLDLRYGGISSPTTDIATLSGLRVGDEVGELEAIYAQFAIEYVVDDDVGLVFELRASQNGPILLWGPVDSQAEDALVTGIYSPNPCTTPDTTDE